MRNISDEETAGEGGAVGEGGQLSRWEGIVGPGAQ